MSDTKTPYLVRFNGQTHLVEAEGLAEVKAFVLARVQFDAQRANAMEVMEHFKGGGKLSSTEVTS